MTRVQREWECMRLLYQDRYSKMYKEAKDEFNTDNHGAMLEMSFVLINIFGLTPEQIKEVERNGGLLDTDAGMRK